MRRLVKLLCALVLSASLPTFAAEGTTVLPGVKDIVRSDAHLDVSRTSPEFTTITMNSPAMVRNDVTVDYQTYQAFGIPGEYSTMEVGHPTVPSVSRFYRIPNTGGVELVIADAEYDVVDNVNALPVQPEDPGFGILQRDENLYSKDEWYPANVAAMSDPMIMRDFRLVQVTLSPVQVNPARHQARIYRNLSVNIVANSQPGQNELLNPRRPSGAWADVYRSQIANLDENALDDMTTTPGSLMILTKSDSVPRKWSDSLAVWKTRKGYKVTVDSRSSWTASQAFNDIHAAYLSSDPPLEFVILMGDPGATFGIPIDGGNFDHTYANMTPGDHIEDIGVGRLSGGSDGVLATINAKIMGYERTPHMETGGGVADTVWYHKAFLYAGVNRGMTSNYLLMRWGRDQFVNWTAVDSITVLTHTSDAINNSDVTSRINAGLGFFLWRGSWINGMPTTIADGTNPGGRYAITMTVTCTAGEYQSAGINSPAEDFLCAGSVTNPGGGVCGMGTSTSGTENGPNGVLACGLIYNIADMQVEHVGTAVNAAKAELYSAYGTTYPDPEDPSQPIALKFTHLFNLLGDPSLSMWTDVPKVLNVTHPESVNVGARSVDVDVTRAADGAAVDGALVVLWKRGTDSTWVRGLTDSQGHVTLPVSVNQSGNMYLTVTKRNHKPYLFTIPCGTADVMPMASSWTLDDDSIGGSQGNGDGIMNPGDTIDLPVYIRNFGTTGTATDISATMASDNPNVTVLNASAAYSNLAPGDSSAGSNTFRIHVAPGMQNGERVMLDMTIASSAGQASGAVPLMCAAGQVEFVRYRTVPTVIDPGTTANVTVVVQNAGTAPLNGVTGHLTSLTPFVRVNAADSPFGDAPVGAFDSNSTAYSVTADSLAFRGQQAPMQLVLTTVGGFSDTTRFILSVGTAQSTDPTGPDAYGYFAYDNTDVSYEMHPVHSYVNISSSGGTNLNLQDPGDKVVVNPIYSAVVHLPFGFKYYGRVYDSLTVCTNGWCAFGNQSYLDMFRNYQIPMMGAPDAMIAPYFDDLRTDSAGFGVWVENDSANHRYIVQWKGLGYSNSCLTYGTVDNSDYRTPLDFEVILYDTTFMPTMDGNGQILVQYNQVTMNITSAYCDEAPGCTIGIQAPGSLVGLQYAYQNSYSPGAATVTSGRAILFTTESRHMFGNITGTVRDAANNQPMANAHVTVDGAEYQTVTDIAGHYGLQQVLVGSYTVRARAHRYNDAIVANLVVELDSTETADFSLLHPRMTLSANEISDSLGAGPGQASFTISNVGNGPLDYSTRVSLAGDPNPGPWDSVGSVNVTGLAGEDQAWGCEYFQNQWWVSGGNGPDGQNVLYRFDAGGNYLGLVPQPSTSVAGWFDLATDGTLIYGSDTHVIYGVDANGQVQDTIPSPINPSRAIAYDPQLQHFWVADYGSSLFEIDRQGTVIHEVPDTSGLNITGLAWYATDPTAYKLYIFSRDVGAGEMHLSRVNPSTYVVESVTDLSAATGEHAAGCTITPDWNSAAVVFAGVARGANGSRIAIHEITFNSSWITVAPASATIPGPGSQGVTLTFTPTILRDATYHLDLRIASTLYDSTIVLPMTILVHRIVGVSGHPNAVPSVFALRQNYPNPFNPTTQIAFDLPRAEHVELRVYNSLGQSVATLLDDMRSAGSYTLTWDGRSDVGADVSTGVYFCQIKAGGFTAVKKMLLMR